MAYSVGFGKLEREILSNHRLPGDVRLAIIQLKQAIRGPNPPEPFENREGVLPKVGHGQKYHKIQVGQATAPTNRFPSDSGSRRLVVLVDGGDNILKIYFSDDHYKPGSWWELQYP